MRTAEDEAVLEAMERYGGSFVRQLAMLARYADDENYAKIKMTWDNYWREYAEVVELKMNSR